MVALHPPLSGMPLAFIVMLCCVELARMAPRWQQSLRTTRNVAILAVVLCTTCAFFSGYQASSPLGDLPAHTQAALGSHHAYGRILLVNALLLSTFAWLEGRATHGKRVLSFLYIFSLIVHLGLTLFVGYLGGGLVFTHRLGVAPST
jgi:uncharacterized membrane protein